MHQPAQKRTSLHKNAGWCTFVQAGAVLCRLVHFCAGWRSLVQAGAFFAGWCTFVQAGAFLCRLAQSCAGWCIFVQAGAVLCLLLYCVWVSYLQIILQSL